MSLYANLQWTQILQQVLLRFNPLVIHYVFSRIMVDQNQNIFVHHHNDIGHAFLVTELEEHEYKTYRTAEWIIIYELYFLLPLRGRFERPPIRSLPALVELFS